MLAQLILILYTARQKFTTNVGEVDIHSPDDISKIQNQLCRCWARSSICHSLMLGAASQNFTTSIAEVDIDPAVFMLIYQLLLRNILQNASKLPRQSSSDASSSLSSDSLSSSKDTWTARQKGILPARCPTSKSASISSYEYPFSTTFALVLVLNTSIALSTPQANSKKAAYYHIILLHILLGNLIYPSKICLPPVLDHHRKPLYPKRRNFWFVRLLSAF